MAMRVARPRSQVGGEAPCNPAPFALPLSVVSAKLPLVPRWRSRSAASVGWVARGDAEPELDRCLDGARIIRPRQVRGNSALLAFMSNYLLFPNTVLRPPPPPPLPLPPIVAGPVRFLATRAANPSGRCLG